MPRPQEFDTDTAIMAATEAFWKHGYEGTSMQDLMDAMGLHKGSIYNSFGDKHKLFTTCLKGYMDYGYKTIVSAIDEEESAKQGLIKAFAAVQKVGCDPSKKGCFGMNTLAEMVPSDRQVSKLMENHFDRVTKILKRTFAKGQEAGEFNKKLDPAEMTKLMMTINAGLLLGCKLFLADTDVDSIAAMSFKMFE